jgi:hypothetical protein
MATIDVTRRAPGTFVVPLLVSASLVAPFIILEWVNRSATAPEFPVALFVFMALHSLLMVFALAPTVRRVLAARSITELTPAHWGGILFGALLIVLYAAAIIDQWPCFMGVPNCD